MKIKVNMKREYIFDLLLFHTYSRFSGFMVNVLGLAIIMVGGLLLGFNHIELSQSLLYVVFGICFLAYTPVQLKIRAGKMMQAPQYHDEIFYEFSNEGIKEELPGNENQYSWSHVEKAIATPKNIAIYVGKDTALILPKESFGDRFMPVMKLITENLTLDKIYIR